MADNEFNNEDELRRMLQNFLSGSDQEVNLEDLAKAAGLPFDANYLGTLISGLQRAAASGNGKVDWSVAETNARNTATSGEQQLVQTTDDEYQQVLLLAELWLSEVTQVASPNQNAKLVTRTQWVDATIKTWTELAEPVATSISKAISDAFTQQAPEEFEQMLHGAEGIVSSIGGTLFAMQLGQVVGQLAKEVVSGGDIGIPLTQDEQALLLPQNISEFGSGLDGTPFDQILLYLVIRELAHSRIFKHAKWLRLHLSTVIIEHSKGFKIDTDHIMEVSEQFDPSNPEEIRELLVSGQLIPKKTDEQLAALVKLETMLALIEGWVDLVTEQAAARLPRLAAISEAVRRRRATGGPAESAFSTLVGLELRPKLLREASAMWRKVTEAVGIEQRDALWAHPDLLPSTEDIQNPDALIARLTGPAPEPDDLDNELRRILDGISGEDETTDDD